MNYRVKPENKTNLGNVNSVYMYIYFTRNVLVYLVSTHLDAYSIHQVSRILLFFSFFCEKEKLY